MDFRAGIFDLDGVLVDTARFHYLAWKRLAAELGFDFTERDNERLKGVSRMRSLEILLSVGGITLTDGEKQQAAEKKNKWYVEYIGKLTGKDILPGAKSYLCYLRDNGILTGLGSASKNTPLILDRLGLNPLLDAVVDGRSVTKAKPDPEVFLEAARRLNVSPENCVVYEDAPAGVQAALAAGMLCVGIGSPEVLSEAHIVVPGLSAADKITVEALSALR